MNDRIKQLRKLKGLSQAAFGERFGASRDMINNIENGRAAISDMMVSSICRTYDVSEEWLRTGNGPMEYPPVDEAASYVGKLLGDEENPLYDLIKSIMKTYNGLGVKEQEIIKDFASGLRSNLKEEDRD